MAPSSSVFLHHGSAAATPTRQQHQPLLSSRPLLLALFVLLLLCAARSHAQVVPGFEGRGLSWEACYRQDHCQRPYYCLHYDEDSAQFRGCPLHPLTGDVDDIATNLQDFEAAAVQVLCHCLPLHGSEGTRCNATVPDCRPGEVCAQSGSGTVCASCDALPSSSLSSGEANQSSPLPANPNNVAFSFVPLDSPLDVARTCSPLNNQTSPSPTPSPSPLPPFLHTPSGSRDFRLGEHCLSNGCFSSSCAPPPGRHLYLVENDTLAKFSPDLQDLVVEHNQFDLLGCDHNSNALCECQVDYSPMLNSSVWPCVTSDDCVDAAFNDEYGKGEGGQFVCARDLRDGTQMCKSCRAVGIRAELLALPDDAKGQACERKWWKSTSVITKLSSSSSKKTNDDDDEMVSKTPVVPTYRGWANGLSFESCLSHTMCQSGRNCLHRAPQGNLEPCNKPSCLCYPSPAPSTTTSTTTTTASSPRDSGELTVCGLTTDGQPVAPSALKTTCPAGETCVVMPRRPPVCVSALAARLQSPAVIAVVGDKQDIGLAIDKLYTPPATGGRRVTGETCRYDWECLDSGVGNGLGDSGNGNGYDNPRRCTHVSERGFDHGRCAGREGCVCERAVPVLCMKTSDCIDNSTETVSSSSSNTNTNENDTDSSSSSSSATTSSQLLSQELCIRARGAPRGMPGRCESPLLFDPDLYTIVGGTTTQQALLGSGLPLLSSSSSVAALGRRLEQEPCTQHSDCVRKHCAHVTNPHGSCTTDGEGCVCISDPVCEIGFIPADAQVRKRPDGFALQGCMTGEACVAVRDQIVAMVTYGIWARCMSRAVMDRRRPFLVEYSHSLHGITASANSSDRDANGTTSTAITPTPVGGSNESSSDDEGASSGNNDDDGDEGVCMDARLLMHLSQEDLVYTRGKEPRAVTLCDTRGSCATPGHMVTWHGKAMTMKTWCLHHASGGGVDGEKEEEGGGCVRRVMKVNSPRVSGGGMMGGRQWQRRVRTKTMDLEFTALAARYGTAVEEGLLRLLVRLGV